ncbi:MAG: alpha/beta fold hydrolase [Kineosporiaceae bacterium]
MTTSATTTTTSALGDPVHHDRRGHGPAVVFVAGAGPYREIDPTTTATAELLATRGFTTLVHDRLGRGENRVAGRVDLDRELAALAALVGSAARPVVLVGHSSGCAIALAAAARGLPVDGLVLWEAPFGGAAGEIRTWADDVEGLLDAGDRTAALEHYMKDIPPELLVGWRQSPVFGVMADQAESLRPDAQALAWVTSAPFADLLGGLRIPVRVVVGTSTLPEMTETAAALDAAVDVVTTGTVDGADHDWQPEAMAREIERVVREEVADRS